MTPASSTTSPSRRYLAATLPFLATDLLRLSRRCGAAPEAPLVTVAKEKSAFRIVAADARAAALGLGPGTALADARAMHPGLAVAEASPEADRRALDRLVAWARRYTPLVAADPPAGLVLDVTGCAHLFGGEAAMLADVAARLHGLGFSAQAAIAGTPEAAAAIARAAPGAIVPPGEEETWLRPLPIRVLALPDDVTRGLERLGLRRVEDIILRPRAPIAARFGDAVLARLDAATGLIRSAIGAGLEAPPYVVERRFLEPILAVADVERTLARLAEELARLLEAHGEGARGLELSLFRVDGAVRRIAVGASRPTREPARIALLFRERLAGEEETDIETGYGFDVVRLSAFAVARFDAAAPRLDGPATDEDFARLLDALGARLGLARVRRPVPRDTHWPEAAAALVSPAREAAHAWPAPPEDAAPDRPIRLFVRPEPIEAVATVPDGPPLRFRWRRVLHETAAYEGPERIAPAWWDESAPTRDYFRTEDREGRRFWIFREGLYGRETAQPRWFVHGLFG